MRRKQDLRRNGCLKNGEHVPAFSNSGMCRFLEWVPICGLSPVGGACPERWGLKSSPRANQHEYPDVVAITKLQELQSWERRKPQSPPLETLIHTLIVFLAYLAPEDQSAPQQVRVEEREANLWCLQLQEEKKEEDQSYKSHIVKDFEHLLHFTCIKSRAIQVRARPKLKKQTVLSSKAKDEWGQLSLCNTVMLAIS